jgi:MFS family permease
MPLPRIRWEVSPPPALGGWMADRLGRNVTMAVSALAGAVCMMAMSQAVDWRALAALAFITGRSRTPGTPASVALVQDIVPSENRVVAYAVQRFAMNLAWSLGPATAGFLAEHSFFWLFAVDATTSAIFGVVAWLFLPRGRKTAREHAGWSHAWQSIRAEHAVPRVVRRLRVRGVDLSADEHHLSAAL